MNTFETDLDSLGPSRLRIVVHGPGNDDRKVYWADGDGTELLESLEREILIDPRCRIAQIAGIGSDIMDLDSIDRQRLAASITSIAELPR